VTEPRIEFWLQQSGRDMRFAAIMRKFAPVVFDATHSVQLPSASLAMKTSLR